MPDPELTDDQRARLAALADEEMQAAIAFREHVRQVTDAVAICGRVDERVRLLPGRLDALAARADRAHAQVDDLGRRIGLLEAVDRTSLIDAVCHLRSAVDDHADRLRAIEGFGRRQSDGWRHVVDVLAQVVTLLVALYVLGKLRS